MNTIKIVVVDDEQLFRTGVVLMLHTFKDVEVLFQAGNGQELLDQLSDANTLPNIILLDLKMPVLNGIETAKILAINYPEIRIIILSSYFSKSFVFNMIELGAAAYLPKNTEKESVELTIRAVHEKGFFYNKEVLQIIRDSLQQKQRVNNLSFEIQLTPREQEILQLICEQHTNQEIAKKLFISNRTVDGHRMNLLQKLNCRNTAGLVVTALQKHLVQIDPFQNWD